MLALVQVLGSKLKCSAAKCTLLQTHLNSNMMTQMLLCTIKINVGQPWCLHCCAGTYLQCCSSAAAITNTPAEQMQAYTWPSDKQAGTLKHNCRINL